MNQSDFERFIVRAKGNLEPRSRLTIPVTTIHNKCIGSLACIDRNMIDDQRIIAVMTKWRNSFMTSFLTRFSATECRTRAWLEQLVLPSRDRLLFVIFLPNNDPAGQIGLCNITENSAELDNVTRGERGADKDLTYNAAIALLKWTFEKRPFKEITLGVLSNNVRALNLYRRLGFVEIKRHTLTRVIDGDTTRFALDQQNGALEDYEYVRMCLSRDQLNQKYTLLSYVESE